MQENTQTISDTLVEPDDLKELYELIVSNPDDDFVTFESRIAKKPRQLAVYRQLLDYAKPTTEDVRPRKFARQIGDFDFWNCFPQFATEVQSVRSAVGKNFGMRKPTNIFTFMYLLDRPPEAPLPDHFRTHAPLLIGKSELLRAFTQIQNEETLVAEIWPLSQILAVGRNSTACQSNDAAIPANTQPAMRMAAEDRRLRY